MVEPFPHITAATPPRGLKVRRCLGLVDEDPEADTRPKSRPGVFLFAVGMTMLTFWAGYATYSHLVHGRAWHHAFRSAAVPALAVGTTELLGSVFEFVRRRVTRHR